MNPQVSTWDLPINKINTKCIIPECNRVRSGGGTGSEKNDIAGKNGQQEGLMLKISRKDAKIAKKDILQNTFTALRLCAFA